jgi:hypothetical protein
MSILRGLKEEEATTKTEEAHGRTWVPICQSKYILTIVKIF